MAVDSKLMLFKNLFMGRTDVFPVYWENKAGRKGYSPECKNRFDKKFCDHRCDTCPNQNFVPLSDAAIKKHLKGGHLVGVYPFLQNETCYFIAADFDDHAGDGRKNPLEDAKEFIETCDLQDIPAYIERSKSGKGFHVWIFFKNPVPVWKARLVAFSLLKEAQVIGDDTDQGSFDRLFPNQDTLSGKGLGNLIALPFYGQAVKHGNSTFLDKDLNPITADIDITAFMESIKKTPEGALDQLIKEWSLTREEPKGVVDYIPPKNLDPQESIKILEDKCKFVQHCRDNQPDILELLWYALASNLARFDGGRDKFHKFSYKHPKYSREETDKKFDHAFTASGPITCTKIKEHGFDCGMNCGVKAPAGLAKKRPHANKGQYGAINESWKEKIDKLTVNADPVEAVQQVKIFVLNDLASHDELTVNRIIKGELRKKFSLDSHEIKGLLRIWKERKGEKETENKALKNIEDGLNNYISSPVYEKNGRIWKVKKGEDQDDIPITTFTIIPLESIFIDGKETIIANIKAGNKTFKRVVLTPECWGSIRCFIKILPGKETIFTGSAIDVQYIRFFQSSFNMPHKTGVRTSGWNEGRFITEDGALSADSLTADVVYFNETKTYCRLLSIEPATAKELAGIKKHITNFNTLSVALPVLGWVTACFFKPVVSRLLDEMGLSNGFPLLNEQGEAGAGKTGMLKNIAMRIWNVNSEPKSIGELTRFTLMKLVDSSNSIPAFLEENKNCMQTDRLQNLISNLIRSTYNCLEGERGRADQTTQVYKYQAPVVIVGETGFTEGALLDRFVTVFLSKKDSAPYLQGFQELRKQPLEKLGRSILEKALRMDSESIKDILKGQIEIVDPGLFDRPRTNAAICRFGLKVLGDLLGMDFNLSVVDQAVKDGIKEGDSSNRKSAVDKILEAMCLISAFQHKTFQVGGTCKEGKEYKYLDHLEEDIDFSLTREPGSPVLKLYTANAYSIFKKWAKLYSFEGEILPQVTFTKQLRKEDYHVSIGHIKVRTPDLG